MRFSNFAIRYSKSWAACTDAAIRGEPFFGDLELERCMILNCQKLPEQLAGPLHVSQIYLD